MAEISNQVPFNNVSMKKLVFGFQIFNSFEYEIFAEFNSAIAKYSISQLGITIFRRCAMV